MSDLSNTQFFQVEPGPQISAKDILEIVFKALKEKGYNPVNQIVGYVMSGDPTYITSYNGARGLIVKIERDELLEEFAKTYGMEFKDFLETQMGMSEDDFNKQAADAAEQTVKSKMVTNAIAEKEKITLSDEAYEKELQKIVDSYGYESVDALKEQVEEEELKITALNSIVVEELTKKCIQNASGK